MTTKDVYNCSYKCLTKGLNGVNSKLSNGQLSKMRLKVSTEVFQICLFQQADLQADFWLLKNQQTGKTSFRFQKHSLWA